MTKDNMQTPSNSPEIGLKIGNVEDIINEFKDNVSKQVESGEAERRLPVNRETVTKAYEKLLDYKATKAELDNRVTTDEDWWKMRYYRHFVKGNGAFNPDSAKPTAWLFNSIMNKHADAMDNIPECSILPTESSDRDLSNILSSITKVILDKAEFEQVYSDVWWDVLKHGTGIYGVFWNSELNHSLGDVFIKRIDVHDLFWESGIEDIQNSRNVFHVGLENNSDLIAKYPQLEDKLSESATGITTDYNHEDSIDKKDKSTVIDWYYKKNINGVEVLHFCKFTGDTVLYSSENENPNESYYKHGLYPFISILCLRSKEVRQDSDMLT